MHTAVKRLRDIDAVVAELPFPVIERLVAPERVLAELDEVCAQPVRRLHAWKNQAALPPLLITWVSLAVAVPLDGGRLHLRARRWWCRHLIGRSRSANRMRFDCGMNSIKNGMRSLGSDDYPYAFHVALDGSGLNGLEGRAGVCVFSYDPDSGRYAYRIEYYDGLAGGHAVSISPDRRTGFLGNAGQHLAFYDTARPEETQRVSTLRFEPTDSSIKGSTHAVWLDGSVGITAIGESFWQFDINRLTRAERLGAHGLKLPHAIRRTASGRYLVYGGMDHPRRGEACEVGVFDLERRTSRRIDLPATCWHVIPHPRDDRFYALSFRVVPQEGRDWHEWAMAYFKEYVFEIDAESGQILRHWTSAGDIPAHINSDVCISDRELIYCTGGSNTVVMIDLETFSAYRMIDERPGLVNQVKAGRQAARQVLDALTRGSALASTKHFLAALRVSRGTLIDGVYACQLSADQNLLFTANRGLNTITVYDYPANTVRLRVQMPDLRNYVNGLPVWTDPRLGFHHGALISPVLPALDNRVPPGA